MQSKKRNFPQNRKISLFSCRKALRAGLQKYFLHSTGNITLHKIIKAAFLIGAQDVKNMLQNIVAVKMHKD